MTLIVAACICFIIHALVASIDGVYFHLIKYKLHTHPESVTEHLTHTLRAGTMSVSAWLFFVNNSGGWLLWCGVLLILCDLCVETWDVLIERKSREHLGGLDPVEYLVHAHSIALYSASYALILASKPAAAFALDSPISLEPYPDLVRLAGLAVAISAALGTIQHTVYLHPRYRARSGE